MSDEKIKVMIKDVAVRGGLLEQYQTTSMGKYVFQRKHQKKLKKR